MSDLLQRARDIAAGAKLANIRMMDVTHPDLRDDEHARLYIGFMRDGHYDDDPIVQAAFAALREGMELALLNPEPTPAVEVVL